MQPLNGGGGVPVRMQVCTCGEGKTDTGRDVCFSGKTVLSKGRTFFVRHQTNKPFAKCRRHACISEHPSRPFLDQTLCEHSGELVARAAI